MQHSPIHAFGPRKSGGFSGSLIRNPVAVPLSYCISQLEAHGAPFRQLIGCLIFAAVATRVDVASIVNQLSQFLDCPSKEHWVCAKHVLRYLKGLCLLMNRGAVDWSARKQTVVTDSTTSAEYVAAHECSRQIVWVRRLLEEVGFGRTPPTVLHMDNAAAEQLVTNPALRERTKHADVKFHYVHERFQEGDIVLRHVLSGGQLADIFTKDLAADNLRMPRLAIGIQQAQE